MPVEIALGTPLADALTTAIQPKLMEVGWGTGSDDSALAEYIILMLVNGKTQEQIAAELSGELLGLPADDPSVHTFSGWLFEQIDLLNAQLSSGQPDTIDTAVGALREAAQDGEMDTDMNANEVSELNAPTGPRSMRNGNSRGGRDKRMLGQMSRAMDRSGDSSLHRVRGNASINTHGRAAPTGPRMGTGRQPRNNNRAAGIQAGMQAGNNWMMNGQPPNQMELMAMMEQQNQMMYQLSQQLMSGPNGGQRRGKSLFDRVQDPHRRRGGHHNAQRDQTNPDGTPKEGAEGGDVEMGGEKREAPSPEDTVCKFNLRCTNSDCKFAHQSPAAPPGASIDVNDPCSFGAACKNRKCVGRHPSPATKLAHQSEQDCKFFPNCQNRRCPFKHPSMPLCRNGAGCTTPDCKFTHVKTKCKFNPCKNPTCAFLHDDGQQGGFKDKVWTAEGGSEHVSERKFVDEDAGAELVKPEPDAEMKTEAAEAQDEVI